MPPDPSVRLARPTEMTLIRAIEDEAGRRFAEVGIDDTELDGLSEAAMTAAIDEDLLFVVTERADVPMAFALCEVFEDTLHLHELDVRLAYQGQGIGRRLLDHVAATAHRRGLARVTLTTYRDVSFNAPFYERYGFRVLAPEDWPTWLGRIRAAEAAAGLDQLPRVAMALTPPTPSRVEVTPPT